MRPPFMARAPPWRAADRDPPHPRPKSVGEETLGRSEAIGLRSVEEGDAEIESTSDGLLRLVGVERAPVSAERPRSKGDGRNVEISLAESDVSHGPLRWQSYRGMDRWRGLDERRAASPVAALDSARARVGVRCIVGDRVETFDRYAHERVDDVRIELRPAAAADFDACGLDGHRAAVRAGARRWGEAGGDREDPRAERDGLARDPVGI